MDTHSKGLTDVNLQVLDLKRASYGFISASPSNKLGEKEGTSVIDALYRLAGRCPMGFGGKRALSGQRCGATRSDGAGLPPRIFGKPLTAPEHKPALPSALTLRGRERGGWACVVCGKVLRKSFAEKSLLILTGFID
jgi:hypothetical protein